jgi:hypothetical protein
LILLFFIPNPRLFFPQQLLESSQISVEYKFRIKKKEKMPGKVEVDLISRDPNDLNNHIQVMFDDVLAEPEGIRSADWFVHYLKQILFSNSL